jgi:hypothetical protein
MQERAALSREAICDIQDRRIVVRVLRVGNRREVYRSGP